MKSSATSSSSASDRAPRGLAAALLSAALLLGGCSAVAERAAMEPANPARAARAIGSTVQVQVSGGNADAGGNFGLRSDDFKAAVEVALQRSGLFERVASAPGGGAAYTLAATLIEVRQPPGGFTMTSEVEVGWSLVRLADNHVLMRRSLATSHTMGVSDAFSGAKRVRMTLEGAARKNIEALLQELAKLPGA